MDREVSRGPEAIHAVRWGLGDVAWIYPAGIVGAVILGGIGIALSHGQTTHSTTPGVHATYAGALTTAFGFAGQYFTWAIGLVWISRTKGRGSLHKDFGFVAHARHWWAILAGVGLTWAVGIALIPIVSPIPESERQRLVDELKSATGAKRAVLIIAAGFLAPVIEELLFRGLLLRALRRRFVPEVAIGISALVFALAHPLLDWQLGTLAIVPGLFMLGVVSGVAATWTGELSISIALHIGFNLLTVALAILRF